MKAQVCTCTGVYVTVVIARPWEVHGQILLSHSPATVNICSLLWA